MTQQRKRIKYLNNADMLVEIHKSKMSYCSRHDQAYADYDVIVESLCQINDTTFDEGVVNRKKRLTTELLRRVQKEHNCTPKAALTFIDPKVIEEIENTIPSEIVIRYITDEHIPEEIMQSIDTKDLKLNFKPFKHYTLDMLGNLDEVVRSHWAGTISHGEFCMTHGRLTEELGRMIIKLNDKIGMKPCYRGYTFLDEMKGDGQWQLTKNGLLFDEARDTKQLNPFAYYTTIVENAFKAVLNREKRNRNIRDDLLQEHGFDPSNTRIAEIEQAQIILAQERMINPDKDPLKNKEIFGPEEYDDMYLQNSAVDELEAEEEIEAENDRKFPELRGDLFDE